ncbi:MAG: uracil-xanthine permease family protein [Syntrophobacteraceae bacterium]
MGSYFSARQLRAESPPNLVGAIKPRSPYNQHFYSSLFTNMTPQYIYDIDDHPPARLALLYGFQWAIIFFPALIIVSTLSSNALQIGDMEAIRFLQLVLLTAGLFTGIQCLWGHRYPILEGPSTALLLTFMTLAPYGISAIQAGAVLSGTLLVCLVLFGKFRKIIAYATPNVVGVILMLIAFSLLPHLIRSMTGMNASHPQGEVYIFGISMALVILIAAFSHWLRGFWKTIPLLLGILLGTALFSFMGLADWHSLKTAGWISLPAQWTPVHAHLYWPAVIAFVPSYLAVVVNSLGSIHGVAAITDPERLPSAITRGIMINGVSGICCGLLGLVGTVSYSTSPGVILANRVASRFTVVYCGLILMVAAFVPKLAALLSLVPAPVVGAALCSAMGAQVGAGFARIAADGLTVRDYFVVGLPLLLGTMVGFLPEPFTNSMPAALRIFLGNGLIVGIFLVLVLEHIILRKKKSLEGGK